MASIRGAVVGLLVVTTALFAASCASPGEEYSDLRGDREAQDALPELGEDAYDSVDASSSRFVGKHDETSLWLAKGRDDSSVCLVAAASATRWVVGCGGAMEVEGLAGEFQVVPDGVPAPESGTRISTNVFAL